MKTKLAIVLCFICSFALAQKNDIWLTTSFTQSNYSLTPVYQPRFKGLLLGIGLGLKINRALNEKSFIHYGLEISSVKDAYYAGSSFQFFTNTNAKIPIGYMHKIKIQNSKLIILQLGINTLIQPKNEFGTLLNNSTRFERKNKGGFFPLLQTGLGVEYTTKKNRAFTIVLLANNGFINTETIKITDANAVTTYALKSTYYAVEFRFKLF